VPEGAEAEFERAVGQYTVNYQNLMSARNVSRPELAAKRKVRSAEVLREISETYFMRGAPPLTEYVGSPSLSDITKALRENFSERTALLFYAYKGEALQIWLINQTGLQAFHARDVPQPRLESAIYDLRSALGVDSLQSARAPSLLIMVPPPAFDVRLKIPEEQAIREVTELLLPASIAEKLRPVRHLIVAPILGLGTVPYSILRPFGPDSFLIDRMSVSVVPSLFDIEAKVKEWTPRYRNPLVVGNPYLPPDVNWRVPPLPGAEEEAAAVAKLIRGRSLTGRRAAKRTVTARAADADFLYFATHGVASNADPLTGGFLFLSARNLVRGFWTAREVQQSRLKAQLAVLSACQTGLGRVHDAGVIGLSRAFQIAGVPRVVMSLWSVNDRATALLMKAFVKYLRSHVPAEALRLAMLEVRREQPKLSHWASFVLFGTPR
jgi:hypothetical protein